MRILLKLRSPFTSNRFKGALYPAIGEKDFLNGVIPIPTLEEQEKIVEVVDEAFARLCDSSVFQTQYADDMEVLKKTD